MTNFKKKQKNCRLSRIDKKCIDFSKCHMYNKLILFQVNSCAIFLQLKVKNSEK